MRSDMEHTNNALMLNSRPNSHLETLLEEKEKIISFLSSHQKYNTDSAHTIENLHQKLREVTNELKNCTIEKNQLIYMSNANSAKLKKLPTKSAQTQSKYN
jgi:DNA-binding protein H-NS